jgi:ATP-dependent Clp protease ATP-binding subunit ClpA
MVLKEEIRRITEALKSAVIGQNHVIEEIVPYIKTGYYNLNVCSSRPICNIFLAGPPATGKTFFVETLSKIIHKTDTPKLLKINCTEFQQDHEISRLIGAPPGYIGHCQTKAVFNYTALEKLKSNNSEIKIILFDEIEKASPALFRILLNIMESGELVGGDNIKINFNNCMIFFTSNLGSVEMTKIAENRSIGFSTETNVNTKQFSSFIKKNLLPEFFSRLDRIIIFNFLTKQQKNQVVINELKKLQDEFLNKNVHIIYKNMKKLVKWVLKNCEDENSNYDLRNIRRVVFTKLLSEIVDEIYDMCVCDIEAEIDVKFGKISVKPKEIFFTASK